MEQIRENIIFMFDMYADKFGDAYTDGSDIVILTSSEEADYIIKHDELWFRVVFDLDEFRDKNYENVAIEAINKDFPEEYLQKVYYQHGFNWNEHGEMEEILDLTFTTEMEENLDRYMEAEMQYANEPSADNEQALKLAAEQYEQSVKHFKKLIK